MSCEGGYYLDAATAEPLRLMAVHAHPDDESSKGAATMARYVDQGAEVLVVTCTGGERGSILNPALQGRADIAENIAEFRRAEMARACAVLGVQHHWLGFVDSGLPESDTLPLPESCFALSPMEEAVERLVRVMRRFRPHVVTTYDEFGGYPHPDHIRCHEISIAAPDPERFPDAGEPWQPLKLYYDVGFSYQQAKALHQAMVALGLESHLGEWFECSEEWLGRRRPPKITTQVKVAEWFKRSNAALSAHATQVDPNGRLLSTPLDLRRWVWPTEDFELVRSLVHSAIPEDDLFAGIRDRVEV